MTTLKNAMETFKKEVPNKVLLRAIDYSGHYIFDTIDPKVPTSVTGNLYAVSKSSGELSSYYPSDFRRFSIACEKNVVYVNSNPEAISLVKRRMGL